MEIIENDNKKYIVNINKPDEDIEDVFDECNNVTYNIDSGIPYKLFRESKNKTDLYFNQKIDKELSNKIVFCVSQHD